MQDTGETTIYSYDARSRLTQSNRTDDNSLNPIVYDYTYDLCDNRLTSNETGPVSTFTYNAFGQLTTSTNGTPLTTYTYDANGNLTMTAEEGSDPVTTGYDVLDLSSRAPELFRAASAEHKRSLIMRVAESLVFDGKSLGAVYKPIFAAFIDLRHLKNVPEDEVSNNSYWLAVLDAFQTLIATPLRE